LILFWTNLGYGKPDVYTFIRALSFLIGRLPLRWALGLGAFLGWLWCRVIPIRRAVALRNLKLAFPDWNERQRSQVLLNSLVNLTQSTIEFLCLPHLDRNQVEALVTHVGWEHYEAALAQGRGVIIATAHFGNFGLLACAEALRGVPLHAVARRQHVGGVDRFWTEICSRCGVDFLPDKRASFRILKLLRSGQAIALVIDQHMPLGRGIPVPFFGVNASTTQAPALLSLTTGAPILPATIERLPDGRQRVLIEPPVLHQTTGDRDEDVYQLTLKLNQWLEDRVRARPDHWLWIHRRWKLKSG
jgi:KDO2-lipid IV(A) lauroyltransferase